MILIATGLLLLQSSPLVSLTGSLSEVNTPSAELVTSKPQWKSLWQRHSKAEEPPEVDFTSCVVLATFQGKEVQTAGYEWLESTLTDGTLQVKIRPKWYSTHGERYKGQPSAAYAFFVLPRSFKRIVVEEQLRGATKTEPPKFKTAIDAKVD